MEANDKSEGLKGTIKHMAWPTSYERIFLQRRLQVPTLRRDHNFEAEL